MQIDPKLDTSALEKATLRRVTLRLMPFMMACYFFALLDRVNVGFASLQMNKDIGLSPAIFGFGASLYFVSYFLLEVPSNLALEKVGARYWISRIMITWGLISAGMAFVIGPKSFYVMRFLLGAAEAGFFPGAILFLTYWLPSIYRARFIAVFAISIPVASFLGSPVSAWLLGLNGMLGLKGWQWLFICEGLPASLLGVACLFVLTDRPVKAKWLTNEQRSWLVERIEKDSSQKAAIGHLSIWKLLRNRQFLMLTIVYSGASVTGSVLAIWQPQILKSFGLTIMQTGLLNSVPYGIASILMILWGRHSDRTNERRWHTALTLLLISAGLGSLALASGMLAPTVMLLSCALIGAYSLKGPFWALASGTISPKTAAAGLAGVNAISNLLGGVGISLVGMIKQYSGSFVIALLPVVLLTAVGGISVLLMTREHPVKSAAETSSTKTT
jgi:MFS transporter, ACS family, tartrate transporter